MNCEELRARLDAYMDGELSDAELRDMEAHAATCADCERELASARLLRELMAEMPEEVAVPLEAQAAWRRAVREEAKRNAAPARTERKSGRRWLRAVYAAAAALVLVLGASAMLRSAPGGEGAPAAGEQPAVVVAQPEIAVMPTRAVIARDGDVEDSTQARGEDYAAWRKYLAEDVEAACATVEELAEEYSGTCGVERFEESERGDSGIATCRVELPREYLDDFLTAVSHVGEEQDSETMETQGETAVVYIQIDARQAE